ncbi:unnamed protein product [Gadus morhua 'NCC']
MKSAELDYCPRGTCGEVNLPDEALEPDANSCCSCAARRSALIKASAFLQEPAGVYGGPRPLLLRHHQPPTPAPHGPPVFTGSSLVSLISEPWHIQSALTPRHGRQLMSVNRQTQRQAHSAPRY